ncbi:MAG: TIGR01212 family radical SAM protein [Thermodesulfobacteriota bacterium]
MAGKSRYNDYNSYLRSLFNERVQKIVIDSGLTCPNRDGSISSGGCIYCNSRGSGTGAFSREESIQQQVEAGKKAMKIRYKARKFLAYFQSYTNTYTSCEHLKSMFDKALSSEGMAGMAVGTRPDCVDEEKLDLIASYTADYLVWVEYGAQSVHDRTLALINRGHTFSSLVRAVEMTRSRGINVCVHVILGLPGEDRGMMRETALELGRIGIDGIKIHLLYVVKGTRLETMWRNGAYTCMEQNEYVEAVCDFIERLPENVVIQRLTGDPHPQELVAPWWAERKSETLGMIRRRLEERDIRQGDKRHA